MSDDGSVKRGDDEIAKRIIEIVTEQTMVEGADVALSSTPDDLGIDSLGQVEIVFAIEEAFDISVPYNANDPSASDFDLSSVGAIVTAVKKLVAERGGG